MHGTQDPRNIAPLVEDLEEGFSHVPVVQKLTVYERKFTPHQLRQIRVQPQAPLLGMEEHPHEPARLLPE